MNKAKAATLPRIAQSPSWLRTFLVSVALVLIAFLAQTALTEVSPGNFWGLLYGNLAAVLMLGSALFGARRRLTRFTKKFGAGRAQTWVQFHVYAGTLFLVLMFLHTGFRLPKGTLTWLLFIASIWVALSGLLGVFLQKWIPTILTSGLSIEVLYERIPELITEIREKSEQILQQCADPVREFYQKNIAPTLLQPQLRWIYYFDITGGMQAEVKQFDYVNKLLSAQDRERLDQLQAYYKTKLELDAHYTLQKALRWWLYLHVPLSLVLLVLVGLHIYSILYY